MSIPDLPFHWFFASVEDVKSDPKNLGRVKVRIINAHDFDEVNTEELLYAQIMMPGNHASFQQVGGSPTGLEIGTKCIGFFMDGNRKQTPVIMGTIHTIPGNKAENHSVHNLAREKQSLDSKNTLEEGKDSKVKEPASAYGAKYYDNKTFTTSSGHVVEIDDTAGAERIHIYHKSGTYFEINNSGRTVLKNVDDYYEIDAKNKHVLVKGNIILEVNGNVEEYIHGNLTRKIAGDVNYEIGGSFNMTAQGGYNLESSSATIKASRIDFKE